MIRKGDKTLKTPPPPLFDKYQLYTLWGVFCCALVFHLFRISEPNYPILGEADLLNNFKLFAHRVCPFDTKPLAGRIILYIPYNLLTNNDSSQIESKLIYLRIISSTLSSFAVTFVSASLLLRGFSIFLSICGAIFILFDGAQVLCTKIYSTDSLFFFNAALVVFLVSVLEKRPNSKLIAQLMCIIAAIASSCDQLGFIIVIYVIIASRRNMERMGTVITHYLLFLVMELSLKTFLCLPEDPDAPEAQQGPFQQMLTTINRLRLRINIPDSYEKIFYWSLCKLRPIEIYKYERYRMTSIPNLATIVIMSLTSVFGIILPTPVFFWLSMVAVWALKPINIMSYTLVQMFGAIAFVEAFNAIHYVIRNLSMVAILTCVIMFFVAFYPYCYGVYENMEYDRSMDFWGSYIHGLESV